jgi:hypothetical protein
MLVKLELVRETIAWDSEGSATLLTERPRIGGAEYQKRESVTNSPRGKSRKFDHCENSVAIFGSA